MPAKNRPLMLRLEPRQHELWLAAADGENIKLSEWIRRACDAALESKTMPEVPYRDRVAPLAEAKESRRGGSSADRAKECPYARNHRSGAFCKFCFKSY